MNLMKNYYEYVTACSQVGLHQQYHFWYLVKWRVFYVCCLMTT